MTTFLFIEEGSGSFTSSSDLCPENLTVSGSPVVEGYYQAEFSLDCSDALDSNADITFSAGQQIDLNKGFCTPIGSTFEAIIQGCR